jgi:hypothetical protein
MYWNCIVILGNTNCFIITITIQMDKKLICLNNKFIPIIIHINISMLSLNSFSIIIFIIPFIQMMFGHTSITDFISICIMVWAIVTIIYTTITNHWNFNNHYMDSYCRLKKFEFHEE